MKQVRLSLVIAASTLLLPIVAFAAEARITKGPTGMPVALYADAQGQKKLLDLPVDAFASRLPLTIVNESNGYILVSIDSREVWIDSEQVKVSRPTKADCSTASRTLAGNPNSDAGVTRGAGLKYNPCAPAK